MNFCVFRGSFLPTGRAKISGEDTTFTFEHLQMGNTLVSPSPVFCLMYAKSAESVDALTAVCFILHEIAILISESCYDGQL